VLYRLDNGQSDVRRTWLKRSVRQKKNAVNLPDFDSIINHDAANDMFLRMNFTVFNRSPRSVSLQI